MTQADIIAELQAELASEQSDDASKEAALTKVIADLQALPTGNTIVTPTALTGTDANGNAVTYNLAQ